MLQWTCLLFAIPSILGYAASCYWTCIGCALLTGTSLAYYHTGHKIPQTLDTMYAITYTLLSTALGAYYALRGCPWNALGVACSVAAMITYVTKSKRGNPDVQDPWHVFVHFIGAMGFVAMTLGVWT